MDDSLDKFFISCRTLGYPNQNAGDKEIAKNIGHPNSARAVANACGRNPYPLIIPCHRVVRSDGKIGGYSGPGGESQKKKLLQKEK